MCDRLHIPFGSIHSVLVFSCVCDSLSNRPSKTKSMYITIILWYEMLVHEIFVASIIVRVV